MGWLGNAYNNIKKKLQDWEQPVAQTVSSGLGQMAQNAKNWAGNAAQNVDNYVSPKIQSFDNNYVKPAENFFQQNPTPVDYFAPKIKSYFGNDATVGGIAKNTVKEIPNTFLDTATGNRDLFPTIKYSNKFMDAPVKNTAKGIYNLGAGIANSVVDEGILRPEQDIVQNIANYMQKKPLTPYDQLKSGAGKLGYTLSGQGGKNIQNIAADVAQTALPVLNAYGGGEGGNLIKSGADIAGEKVVPALKDLMWQGAKSGMKFGGAFGGLGAIADSRDASLPKMALNTVLGTGAGILAGGILGAGAPVAGAGLRKIVDEPGNLKTDIANLMNPTAKRVVTKFNYEPVPDIFAPGGEQVMRPIPESGVKTVETVKTPFEPKSMTGKILTSRPGLNIEDVSGGQPSVNPYEAKINKDLGNIDERIAQKRAQAKELVSKQIGNQKANLNTAESGFVPPQAVTVPTTNKPKYIQDIEAKLKAHENGEMVPISNKELANYSKWKVSAPVDNKIARQNFREQKNAMGQSLSFFNDELDGQYAQFKKLYNRYSSGKGREAFESMDPQSIKNYLAGKVSPTEIDNILYSQEMHPDEVLDKFMTMNEKEKAYKNLKFTPSEKDKAMASALGLPENKIPPSEKNPLGTPEGGYNYWQQKAYNTKGGRIKNIKELINYPRELVSGGYFKNEVLSMGKQEADLKASLLKQGFPKDVIEKMDPETARNLVNKNIKYNSLPNQDTLNEVKLKITGNTEKERVQSAIVNSERIRQEINIRGKDAYVEGKKLSKNDLKLSEQYEHGVPISQIAQKAENPQQMTNYLNTLKDYYDFRLAADRAVGGETPRRENYVRHIWDLSNPEDLAKFNELSTQRGLRPWNGFSSQPRVFKTYAKGEALGFKRMNPSLLEDLRTDYGGASNALSKQALVNGLHQAVPEKVSMTGTGMTKEGKPFINSNIPGLEGVSYAPEIHSMLSGYQPRTNKDFFQMARNEGDGSVVSTLKNLPKAIKDAGFLNSVGTLYDHATQPMKHFLLNFAGFHSINVSANYSGASLFEANMKGTKGIAESIPSFFSENVTRKIIDSFKSKGIPGTNYSVFDAGLRSGVNMERGLPAKGLRRLNLLATSTRAIFDRELYTLKLNLVDQVFGSGKVNPESPQGRALGKEINMVMGEMNNRTMNINPNTQKWLSRLLLAPQFTESKYKLIGNALSNNPIGGNSMALKAAVGKSIVMGTLASLGTALMTGKVPNLQQLLLNFTSSPETQTNLANPSGRKLAVSWPKTFVSEPLSLITDPIHYGQARLNPALSDILSVVSNQDYYGNPIVDPNSKKSATEQVIRNIGLGDLPIGVQNVVNYAEGKQTGAQMAINIGGLRAHIDPSDPTAIYFKNLDDAKAGLTNPNDIAAWNIIHPVNKTTGGEYIIQPTVWDSAEKATTFLSHPNVLDVETKMNQILQEKGQTIDPFFNLTPDQQKIALTYATLPPQDPQKTNIENSNPWMPDFQKQRSDFFATLPPTNPDKPKQDIQYPQPSPEVEKLQNQYYAIEDPKQRAQFIANNPTLTDQFSAMDKYNRAIREAKNLPQYDQYPESSPELQKIMDEYNQLPKGTGARSAWIRANPKAWNDMITYYTQTSVYNLGKSAQQAAFQNTGLDQKGLKAASNLGQMDIAVTTDANGNKIYSLAPGGASGGGGYGYGYGGGSKAKYASIINNNPLDALIMAKKPPKFRITKKAVSIPTIQFAKARRKPGRIIHLNKLKLA